MTAFVLGLPNPLVEEREAGIFRSFKINGVPALAILVVPVLATVVHVLITAGIITITGPALFAAAAPVNCAAFALVTLVVVFALAGFGVLIGVAARDSRSTVLWSQLIFLPSMLLGGLMMPLDVLPATVRPVSMLLATSHAMQAYAGFAYGAPTAFDPGLALGVLAAGGVLAFALAAYLFNWDTRNQARRGHPLMALLVLAPYVLAALLAA